MGFFGRLIIWMVLVLNAPVLAEQDDGKWVTASGKVILAGHMTAEEAKQLARRRARSNAIDRALGVDVTAEQFLQKFEVSRESGDVVEAGDSFANYIRESRRGRIVQEEVWQERDTVLVVGGTTMIQRIAQNRFYVVAEEEKPDPAFKLELVLPKKDFKAGEGLAFDVKAAKDCYLTVFNLTASDSVYLLFPNVVELDNRLEARKSRRIPGRSYVMELTLPPNKQMAIEYLVAVATKDSVAFIADETVRPGTGYAETLRTGLNQLWQWIAEIDADRRVEAIEAFRIFR